MVCPLLPVDCVTLTVPPSDFTSVFAAFSWLTLTASVSAVPVATLVICLPPTSMPVVVTDGPPVMVRPVLLTVVFPTVTLPSAPRLIFFASLTVSTPFLPLCSETTPILLSLSWPAVVIPPFTVTLLSSGTVAVPVSPSNVSPLAGLDRLICSLLLTTDVVIPSAPTTWTAPSIFAVALLFPFWSLSAKVWLVVLSTAE